MDAIKTIKSLGNVNLIDTSSALSLEMSTNMQMERMKKYKEYQKAIASGYKKDKACEIVNIKPSMIKRIQKEFNVLSPFLLKPRKKQSKSGLNQKSNENSKTHEVNQGQIRINKDKQGQTRSNKDRG